MPILEGDIKIRASQLLADVPEGGGAATGTEIIDGKSNNLFADVAELEHVYGSASLRKFFVSVETASRDVYMGAHAFVAEDAADPGVSCLLFSTGDAFDTRAQAKNRIESYLIQGALYQGLLFGDHIQGQMAVMLSQREGTAPPLVGETLLLRKNEGLGSQVEQFLKIIDVASEVRTFTDDQGDFKRLIVTLSVSAQLSTDFKGFPAARRDSSIEFVGRTKVYETSVADASRYYGIKPLVAAAGAGDRVVQANGIFVPLVPSSRTEVGIADARMNQISAALVPGSAGEVQLSTLVTFNSTSGLSIGGGIMPGTLSARISSTLLTDNGGGALMNGATAVGLVDYANGLLALSTDLFGSGAVSADIAFTPSAPAQLVSESVGLPVTQASRRLTWVATLNPPPAPGSLQISYRSQGRWYVLQEDGSGAIRGSEASFGAGALNFSTNTMNLTLGALPDVPSSVILTWAPRVAARLSRPLGASSLPQSYGPAMPVMPAPVDVRAVAGITLGRPAVPGSLTLTWDGKTASDATGTIAGDAKGAVAYETGQVRFAPNQLPAKGTVVTASFTEADAVMDRAVAVFIDAGSTYTCNVGGPIKPRSLALQVTIRYPVRHHPGTDLLVDWPSTLRDNGAGQLLYGDLQVGTVAYANGDLVLQKSFPMQSIQDVFSEVSIDGTGSGPKRIAVTGTEKRSLTPLILNGPTVAAKASYASTNGAPRTSTHTVEVFTLQGEVQFGSALSVGGSFNLGGRRFNIDASGAVFERAAGLGAGGAIERGIVNPTTGQISLGSWAAGITNEVKNWSASQAAVSGLEVDLVTFRTAAAPVAPSGFSVIGDLANGTSFTVSADEHGRINGGGVFGTIDYETGIVQLRFGTATAATSGWGVVDLSYLGIPGVTFVQSMTAKAATLRYNAVAYSWLPLEADILGLDPVRLPSDGRVPIFRRGGVAVVHHTAETAAAVRANGNVVDLGRTKVGQVRAIGANGQVIRAGYTLNRAAGTVTCDNVTGWTQPVKFEHRIEEAALLADVQISGLLRLNRPLSRAYPAGSKISSALLLGNVFARVSLTFDQASWNNGTPTWSNDVIGGGASPTLDTINYPILVDNLGSVTERWVLVFDGSTAFRVIGEHLGQIGVGNTASDCQPINPATNTPFFTIDRRAFGSGWSAGNAIRINTVGAQPPIWAVRVVQQGEPIRLSDRFTFAVRGDVDTP